MRFSVRVTPCGARKISRNKRWWRGFWRNSSSMSHKCCLTSAIVRGTPRRSRFCYRAGHLDREEGRGRKLIVGDSRCRAALAARQAAARLVLRAESFLEERTSISFRGALHTGGSSAASVARRRAGSSRPRSRHLRERNRWSKTGDPPTACRRCRPKRIPKTRAAVVRIRSGRPQELCGRGRSVCVPK